MRNCLAELATCVDSLAKDFPDTVPAASGYREKIQVAAVKAMQCILTDAIRLQAGRQDGDPVVRVTKLENATAFSLNQELLQWPDATTERAMLDFYSLRRELLGQFIKEQQRIREERRQAKVAEDWSAAHSSIEHDEAEDIPWHVRYVNVNDLPS